MLTAPTAVRAAPDPGDDEGRRVALRALVISFDRHDWGETTWRVTLDRLGAPYDVLHSSDTRLTEDVLVRPDGTGRYDAILLTSAMQLAPGGASALDPAEWQTLWAYERRYGVRQATLYASYGTWPEDYCLAGAGEGPVADAPLDATLTARGAEIFDYLRPDAVVPITRSYVYRNRIRPGCAAEPVLVAGPDVLAAVSTAPDGRERIALSVTTNQYLRHTQLLVYGLFRWATRGVHLGAQRHYLNVDVDDWFNAAAHLHPDGRVETTPGFRVSGHDMFNLRDRQDELRRAHPTLADFSITLAYNGGYAHLQDGGPCAPDGGVDTLTATSRCLADEFRWLNHTYRHPKMNHTDYPTSRAEIAENLRAGRELGLEVPADIVKTGEYSGLGVYHDDPDETVKPPMDRGLRASNPHLLAAARDLGVRFLHGNMSFASHQPPCFNCGIPHPLEPSVTVVPDWPTGIAYHTTTAAEQTYFANWLHGPGGQVPRWPRPLSYAEILEEETSLALDHIATGSLYAHTFHIANVRDYGGGRTLLTDWLDRVLTRYEEFYAVPVLSPDWPELAELTVDHNAHFEALAEGAEAVLDRTTGEVTVTSPTDTLVILSGVRTTDAAPYGRQLVGTLALAAGTPRALPLA
ncbi:MAG TPA: hypothetical protein VNV66_18320 [Pilimelia sp.]|nr:hypothetical protein [Pilimelia sp.]